MPLTSTQSLRRGLSPVLAACCLICPGCAAASSDDPGTLPPAALKPINADSARLVTRVRPGTTARNQSDQLRAVSHVVRHWFARYGVRYSDVVRVETLVAHIDSPTWADVFVIATFRNAGSIDSHGRPILARPKQGRYYRSVQLQFHNGRWHIESVRPT